MLPLALPPGVKLESFVPKQANQTALEAVGAAKATHALSAEAMQRQIEGTKLKLKVVAEVGRRAENAFFEVRVDTSVWSTLSSSVGVIWTHFVGQFVRYYHNEHPHQGIGNRLLIQPSRPPPDQGRSSLENARRVARAL